MFLLNVPHLWQRTSPGMERIGLDGGAAVGFLQTRAKVVQTFQVAALALPVADRVIDKGELAQAAEIRRSGKRI